MKNNTYQNGQGGLINPALDWLKTEIVKIGFGTISGIEARNGTITKGPNFSRKLTRKPQIRGLSSTRDKIACSQTLHDALDDLARDANGLSGRWDITIKIANGVPLSWEMEESGLSASSETK